MHFAYTRPVGLLGWNLMVIADGVETTGDLAALRTKIVLFSLGLALLLVVILRMSFNRLVLRRILRLEQATRALARNEDPAYPPPGRDELGSLIIAFRDMVKTLKEKEIILRTKSDELQAIMDNALAIITVKDRKGRYLLVNRRFEEITGFHRGQAVGKTMADILPEEMANEFEAIEDRVFKEGRAVTYEKDFMGKDGSSRTYLHVKFPLHDPEGEIYAVCGMSTDITERKRAEEDRLRLKERIQQGQMLESLGVLAGGIAHDFNNLLVGVLGNAGLVLEDLPPHSDLREYVRDIETAAHRAADLCNQMLAYSGKGRFIVASLDLNALVNEMVQLLEISVSKKADLRLNLSPRLPLIEADATQVRQVIMNLITNASEALEDRPGTITLSTSTLDRSELDVEPDSREADLPQGPYVCFEVTDTGCGMDDETQRQIFEPFFTTKFTGRGLGMSAVQGIIRSHNGIIRIRSTLDQGATFRIFFPANDTEAAPSTKPPKAIDTSPGNGMVMLVDDESMVRDVGRKILENKGYHVIEAVDGVEAVRLFEDHAGLVDCVVLDLTMPRMDGVETFRALRRIRKDVHVILSSGYSEAEVNQRFEGDGPSGFVQKPFSPSVLVQAIGRVLSSKKG